MDAQSILNALALGEDADWEFKCAKGGLPSSLWETYSAMANTEGGTIVLGVEQKESTFAVSGVDDPGKLKQDFWNTVNNRGKVSVNLLTNDSVKARELAGRQILAICIPRASRHERPVYVGQNPLTGTFRRNHDGDYRCNEYEVGRMLADRSDEPADSRIVENFSMFDLDEASLQQYRQRFSARSPGHPWLSEDLPGFLEKLGGWRRDRITGREGITLAGLLMFGKDEAIRDPSAVPEYNVDYRERLSDDPQVRWTDRLTVDGTWVANLFQFFQRVIQKLTSDLKIPFKLEPNLLRRDDTLVHEAIREALVNALIHADYRGQGGIIIEKHKDRLEMSNPGTLLVSFEQLLRGGVSECRNKSLQQMFVLIGGGERAGSGIDKIRQGWQSQHWRWPGIRETFRPDRVHLVLPMVSLLPEESVRKLEKRFGPRFSRLGPLEVQALVTADLEGSVTNARMQELRREHPADVTAALQGLTSRGFLLQDGQKRWASYRLPVDSLSVGSAQKRQDSSHKTEDSLHKPDSSHKGTWDSSHSLEDLPQEELRDLRMLSVPASSSKRLAPEETRRIILLLCSNRFLTAAHLGELMDRSSTAIRSRFLTPLVNEGLLRLRYPDKPNRPDQAYKAAGR